MNEHQYLLFNSIVGLASAVMIRQCWKLTRLGMRYYEQQLEIAAREDARRQAARRVPYDWLAEEIRELDEDT